MPYGVNPGVNQASSGVSCSAVHEFKVNESTVYIKYSVFKQNTRQGIDQVTKMV